MRGFLLLLWLGLCAANTDWLQVTNSWNGGFEGDWIVRADNGDLDGWQVIIKFDRHIDKLEIWKATVIKQSDREFVLQGIPEYAHLDSGSELKCHFVARAPGDQPAHGYYVIQGSGGSGTSGSGNTGSSSSTDSPGTSSGNNGGDNSTYSGGAGTGGSGDNTGTIVSGNVPSGPVSNMRHDYGEAMKLSILFYDAQRSGRLPAGQPISWRGDSCVNDNGNGHDLSGGWYDDNPLAAQFSHTRKLWPSPFQWMLWTWLLKSRVVILGVSTVLTLVLSQIRSGQPMFHQQLQAA